jgi:hypothetical protein
MTADHSSDSGRQRTVAELLEQYGADGAGGGRRRRRSGRGADAEPATRAGELPTPDRSAVDSAVDNAERTWSSLSAVSAEERGELGRGGPDADDSPWRGYGTSGLSGYGQPNGAGTYDHGDGGRDASASEWARPGSAWTRSAADPLSSPTGSGSYPVEGYLADPEARAATPLSAGAPGDSYLADSYPLDSYSLDSHPSGLTKPPEEPTEQMPKYPKRPGLGQRPGPATGPITDPLLPRTPPGAARKSPTGGGTGAFPAGGGRTGATRAADGHGVESSGPNTQVTPAADLFEHDEERDDDFEPAEAPAARARGSRAGAPSGAAALAGGRAIPDVPAGLEEEAELEERSGLKAWAILIAQGLGGAIGGAVLWVGFRYLWLNLPVVALAAAVVATVGLVFVVRTIRGSEDLQTTMLAVLVGLIVTISPAVLLLAVR